jgi:hypothetical protein
MITVIYRCSLDVLLPVTEDRVLKLSAVLECQERKRKGRSSISETHNNGVNIASEFTYDTQKICLKTGNGILANIFFLVFINAAGVIKRISYNCRTRAYCTFIIIHLPHLFRVISLFPTSWTAGFRFLARTRDIFPFIHSVQTCFGAYPASYQMNTNSSFPRGKAVRV